MQMVPRSATVVTLSGHYAHAVCKVAYASFGAHHRHLGEYRPILSAAKMLPRDYFQTYKVRAVIGVVLGTRKTVE